MKKKLLIMALLSTAISVISMKGILVNASTLETATEVLHDITPKAKTIYPKDSFRFTTVGTLDGLFKEKLTLEDYLIQEIRNFNTEFIDTQAYKISIDDLKNTFGKILYQNADLFYLSEQYSYAFDGDNNVLGVKFNYKTTKDNYINEKALIDEKFAPIIDSITDDMTDYEKVLVVHDYICTNFSYDLTYSIYNLLDFVKNGTGVCQAYYQAYNYILTELGINNYPIQSELINHIWNVVELDGKYYQIDTTWDDYTPDLLGWSSHTNFLMDDTASAKQHNLNGKTDWYTYDDNISTTDDSFKDYKFKTQNNPFVIINSDICYIDNGVLCKYDFDSDSSIPLNEISPEHKWYNLNASIKQYYKQTFYSINKYKDIFFVNTSEKVLVLNNDYQIIDTLYTHSDTTNYLIYGMTIRDEYILIQLESNPNAGTDSFGHNVIPICNVEQYYQKYLKSKDTFISTQPIITTTEPVTTETTTLSTTTTEPITTKTTTTEPITTVNTTTPTTTTENAVTPFDDKVYYDVNNDNIVNILDFLILKSYIYKNTGLNERYTYDVNNDNEINVFDIIELKKEILSNNL